jgi:hypothetical protein
MTEVRLRTAADYADRFTVENEDAARAVIDAKGLHDLSGLMIRHTLKNQDGSDSETLEATVEEALVICPPLRELSAPLLQMILPRANEVFLAAHPTEG